MLKSIVIVFVLSASFSSCTVVKPYQRVYLNDPEMQIGASVAQKHEEYVQIIREGSTNPGSAKASGGCGCN